AAEGHSPHPCCAAVARPRSPGAPAAARPDSSGVAARQPRQRTRPRRLLLQRRVAGVSPAWHTSRHAATRQPQPRQFTQASERHRYSPRRRRRRSTDALSSPSAHERRVAECSASGGGQGRPGAPRDSGVTLPRALLAQSRRQDEEKAGKTVGAHWRRSGELREKRFGMRRMRMETRGSPKSARRIFSEPTRLGT
ncbi:unnamed protein product, partial [Ixodes pacificus]